MKDRMFEILNLSSFKLSQKKRLEAASLKTLFYKARAKSEALVNNTYKQKKLNRVMLNGDDNENGFKTNRSN